MLNGAQTQTLQDVIFRMDELVKFSNPALYTLDKATSSQNFQIMYFGMCAVFYIMITILIVLSNTFVKAIKDENYKQATKVIIKFFSLLMMLFLTVF